MADKETTRIRQHEQRLLLHLPKKPAIKGNRKLLAVWKLTGLKYQSPLAETIFAFLYYNTTTRLYGLRYTFWRKNNTCFNAQTDIGGIDDPKAKVENVICSQIVQLRHIWGAKYVKFKDYQKGDKVHGFSLSLFRGLALSQESNIN